MLVAFHLGRVYTLSLAELFAVFEQKSVPFKIKELYTEVLIIETPAALDFESLQRRLGGVVKIIEIVDTLPRKKATDFLSFTLKDYLHPNIIRSHFIKPQGGKLQLGISIYKAGPDQRLFGQNKRIGMELKRGLTMVGLSSRIVIPEGASLALPSVAVTNNLLLQKGAEIDLIVTAKQVYVGKTATVQDFQDYGRRDYQRPVRDTRIGMLPPKVAQEMINLAKIPESSKAGGEYVLDPFCGSGTILQEAMLMGYRVHGSDVSDKAVEAAEKNLNWFRPRYKRPPNRFEVAVSDVKDLEKNVMENKKIACVVTEGTLGPPYDKPPGEKEIEKNFKELAKLHTAAFSELYKLLPAQGRIVIAFPAYRKNSGYVSFPGLDKILELGYDIQAPLDEKLLAQYPFLKVTPRRSIIYDRKDQIVVREIMIFKKTS